MRVAYIISSQVVHLDQHLRHAAVGVGKDGALHGLAVDHAHILVRQEVQAVEVALQLFDEQILRRLLTSTMVSNMMREPSWMN